MDIPPSLTERRNFRLGVANGILYIIAETLLDPTLVLVTFLGSLTNSPLLLGLVLPIRDGAWSLPQLWTSRFLQNQPRKIVFYRRVSWIRIATWALLALTINFISETRVLLISFFIVYTLSSLVNGLGGLPFMEIVGKTVPSTRRGEFFAWRLGLGGLGGVAASYLVRLLLDPSNSIPFPHNFGILAGLFFVFASISMLVFNDVDEPADATVLPIVPLREQFRRAVVILKHDADYRRLLALQSILILAGSATPFFAVYVQRQLGGSKAMVGVYLAVLTTTNLVSNFLFGRLSRKIGTRRILNFAVIAGMSMSFLVFALSILGAPLHLSPQAASLWLVPVFVLAGIRGTGVGVGGNSLLLAVAPPADRSLYIGFTNTLLGIVLLLTAGSGLFVQWIGFGYLFLGTVALHVVALVLVRRITNQGY